MGKINSIWVFVIVTTGKNWFLYQLDVKNTVSNPNLEEELFMDHLDLKNLWEKIKFIDLKNSFYGLKQSLLPPFRWFGRKKDRKVFEGNEEGFLYN